MFYFIIYLCDMSTCEIIKGIYALLYHSIQACLAYSPEKGNFIPRFYLGFLFTVVNPENLNVNTVFPF